MLQVTSQGLSILVGVAVFGMISRTLGAEGYGIFALATTFAAFSGIVLDAGLDTHVISRLAASGAANPVSAIAQRTISDALTVRIVLGAAATSVAVVVTILGGYPPTIQIAVAVLSITTLGGALTALLGDVFQAAQDVLPTVLGGLGSRLFSGLAVLVLFILHALNLWSLIAAIVGAAVVSLMITGGIGLSRGLRFRRPSLRSAWRLYRAAAPLAIWVILGQVLYRADVIVLSAVRFDPALQLDGPEAVGIYVAAYKFFELSNALPGFIVVSLMPVMSELAASDRVRMAAYIRRWFVRLTGMGLVFGAVFAIAGGPFLQLLSGPEFQPSARLVAILAGAMPFAFMTSLLFAAIVSTNRRTQMVWLYVVIVVVNVGGNIMLAPTYAYWAAAWLTTACQALLAAGMYWLMRRELWPR